MNTIQIRLTGGKRPKIKQIVMPECWEEVPPKLLPRLANVALPRVWSGEQVLEMVGLFVPSEWLKILEAAQVVALGQLLAFVHQPLQTAVLPSFWHRHRRYYLPNSKLENITCGEWYRAESAHEEFLKTGNRVHLQELLAILCRPADGDHQRAMRRGDLRQPLGSSLEVEARQKALEGLSEELQAYVFLFFTGCKQYVHETYKDYIFPSEEGDDSGGGDDLPFGWYSIYQSVAESGVFGNLENLLQEVHFHDFCAYLVTKKIQFDNWKARQERRKSEDKSLEF